MTLLRLLRAAPRSTSIAACSEVSFTPSTLNNASSSVEWPGRNFKVEAGGLLIAAAAGPATAAAAALAAARFSAASSAVAQCSITHHDMMSLQSHSSTPVFNIWQKCSKGV